MYVYMYVFCQIKGLIQHNILFCAHCLLLTLCDCTFLYYFHIIKYPKIPEKIHDIVCILRQFFVIYYSVPTVQFESSRDHVIRSWGP